MEIERKYLVTAPPANFHSFPFRQIEQAYLCTEPTVRIRKEDDSYYLTYKGKGLLSREEYNLPLTEEAYLHLLEKADGIVLTKRRYLLPLSAFMAEDTLKEAEASLTIEFDVFEGIYKGLMLAEVEFLSAEAAMAFVPPSWFGEDVTFSGRLQNSRLASERIDWRA